MTAKLLHKEYCEIGILFSTSGIKGEIIFKPTSLGEIDLNSISVLFIEDPENSFLPYFIEHFIIKNTQKILLKLEGINTKEQASQLLQKKVWILKEDFKKGTSLTSPISLIGFDLIDKKSFLGVVKDVIRTSTQWVIKIIINNTEVFIPLQEEIILKIDLPEKKLYMSIPEGLLEVYLS